MTDKDVINLESTLSMS